MRKAIFGLTVSVAALVSATPAMAANIVDVTINWASAPVETFKIDLDAGFPSTSGSSFVLYNLIDNNAGHDGIFFGKSGYFGTGVLQGDNGGKFILTSFSYSSVLNTPVYSGSGLVASLVPGQSYASENGSVLSVAPLATGAVPEPATWAMMLAGFGAVGFVMRRRQRQTVRYSFG